MGMFVQGRSGPGAAWREMEAWRAKQKQFAANAEASNSGLASALLNTSSSSSDGIFELTVRKAIAAARQRASERAKLNRLDTSV